MYRKRSGPCLHGAVVYDSIVGLMFLALVCETKDLGPAYMEQLYVIVL